MARRARVIRPSWGWFALLDGGIVVMSVLAASEQAHAAVSEALPAKLPGRTVLKAMCVGTAVIHVAEAAVAARLARRRGLPARGWAVQTFIVGFPSLLALRKAS
ncbi:MAG TPA: DUF4499 domain-containing protein [Acidimicrobiales bacterium]|nr:DUF4499 domain-containing protein [Acidimicrobiales bacterium]